MKTTTLVIIAVAIIVLLLLSGTQFDFGGTPNVAFFNGRLKINFVQVKRVDGSAYEFLDTELRVIHQSDYNDKVGTISSRAVSGVMKPEDKGTWTLVIDYGTNTTAWLDIGETAKQQYIKRIYGADGDRDGFNEEYIEMYFGDEPPLTAGESYREVEVTLVECPARIASIGATSLTNSTGIGTSSYSYETSTGYLTGFTEGDLGSLAKIELTFADSGNTTYPDTEYWKLVHVKLGPYTFTAAQFGSYDLANTRYQVKFGDQVNHHGGRDLYYEKNSGDTWATYEIKSYCKYPSSSKTIYCTLKLYFYSPAGTITAAFTQVTSWAS